MDNNIEARGKQCVNCREVVHYQLECPLSEVPL